MSEHDLVVSKKEKNKITISVAATLIGAYLLGGLAIYLLSLCMFIDNLSMISMLALYILPGLLYTTIVSFMIRVALRNQWSLQRWLFDESDITCVAPYGGKTDFINYSVVEDSAETLVVQENDELFTEHETCTDTD